MTPPIFQVCAADPAVTALLGTDPVRLFPFGNAPQGVQLPYCVWQTITGVPENYMDCPPDMDRHALQVDVYAATGAQARQVVQALRAAIEPHAHIVSLNGESTEPSTGHRRSGFDVDWFVTR